MRAVVAGDRPPFNAVVTSWLSHRQASVGVASSPEELAAATRADPLRLAVIWSEDGYRAVSAIRRLRDAAIGNLIMVMMPAQCEDLAADAKHRAVALRAGADDAQTWPLAEDEFIERCRALIRRDRGLYADENIVRFAGCDFLPELKMIRSPAGVIALTPLETAYMLALTRHDDRVVTNKAISIEVYGWDHQDISPSLVKVFVHRLRKQIFVLTGGLDFLETVWGRGYRFVREGYRPKFDHWGRRAVG
ncbi:two-component system cell cycle response regulator CtrA [Aminobacter niigataensis]|uniref:Two-component system cell cycle response regulator CtrA n=1 Tax=Aminobacter niigataensis TaxID=83265 RepID=A0ABR6L847_9HYPH|nr:winged helix-turn-helix domain-containing protein [Aminobacter niigataensis]MBB4652977.1 two-component system cell cycle response regulator CtrA [Aminobacter niigataensis]